MNKLTRNQFWVVSLMLFSLFFGAGNFIFPPIVGKMAGKEMILSMLFFGITSVVLPVLGIVAVAKANGLDSLGNRVSHKFSVLFTLMIYLSVGPLMGIPRAGTVPFEIAIAPHLTGGFSPTIALLLFTLLFFVITYLMSLNPQKMANTIGKYLTPLLILLIVVLFVSSLINPMGSYGDPIGQYEVTPYTSAFLEGYMTMDTMGALNFGIVIALVINSFNVKEESLVIGYSIKAGLISGTLLMIIYFMLAHIGASSTEAFPDTTNGAQILSLSSNFLFGKSGSLFIGLAFTLACLTTSIGLISSCSQFFVELTGKLDYKKWVLIWCVISFLIANVGLDTILGYTAPSLEVLYPIAIVLILLVVFESLFKTSTVVYKTTVYTTAFLSLINVITGLGVSIPYLTHAINNLPLAENKLGWILPALLAFLLSWGYSSFKEAKK